MRPYSDKNIWRDEEYGPSSKYFGDSKSRHRWRQLLHKTGRRQGRKDIEEQVQDMNKPDIIKELKKINRPEITDPEHECTASEISWAVCMLLEEIILKDDAESDKFGDWVDEIKSLRCKIIGEHMWIHDHCGHWAHQYCFGCNKAKYPKLIGMRCSEIKYNSELEYNEMH